MPCSSCCHLSYPFLSVELFSSLSRGVILKCNYFGSTQVINQSAPVALGPGDLVFHRILHQVAGWISLKMNNLHSNGLPSGKRLHSYGKSQLFIHKSTISISMAIFNSYVTNYRRVSCITSITIFSFIPEVVYPI
jgi:hypothetical protein